MCLKLGNEVKKQAAVGFPSGWTYIFAEDMPNPNKNKLYVPGLTMFYPNSTKFFRSAEAAASFDPSVLVENPHAVAIFYEHVGIKRDVTSTSSGSKSKATAASGNGSALASQVSPMTLQELLKRRCGKCVHCTKTDCGRCAACVSNRRSLSQRQVCIQKVCVQC